VIEGAISKSPSFGKVPLSRNRGFESRSLQRRVGSELGPDRDHNFVRTALYEAANVILTRPVKGSTLKSWAMPLAARAGMRKAKVALARKLAVVLHRMLVDGTSFLAEKAAVAAAH
jgi:hypothetical protein